MRRKAGRGTGNGKDTFPLQQVALFGHTFSTLSAFLALHCGLSNAPRTRSQLVTARPGVEGECLCACCDERPKGSDGKPVSPCFLGGPQFRSQNTFSSTSSKNPALSGQHGCLSPVYHPSQGHKVTHQNAGHGGPGPDHTPIPSTSHLPPPFPSQTCTAWQPLS